MSLSSAGWGERECTHRGGREEEGRPSGSRGEGPLERRGPAPRAEWKKGVLTWILWRWRGGEGKHSLPSTPLRG